MRRAGLAVAAHPGRPCGCALARVSERTVPDFPRGSFLFVSWADATDGRTDGRRRKAGTGRGVGTKRKNSNGVLHDGGSAVPLVDGNGASRGYSLENGGAEKFDQLLHSASAPTQCNSSAFVISRLFGTERSGMILS